MTVSVQDIGAGDLVRHYAAVRRRLMGPRPSASIIAFPKKTNPGLTSSPYGYAWLWGSKRFNLPSLSLCSYAPPASPPPRPIKILDIQRVVCRHYHLSRNDLLSHRRTADVTFARQVSCYLAKTLTLESLPEIGRQTGDRDHTTVLHAVRKITAMAAINNSLSTELNLLEHKIRNGEAA